LLQANGRLRVPIAKFCREDTCVHILLRLFRSRELENKLARLKGRASPAEV
jgi:hypothetical protein